MFRSPTLNTKIVHVETPRLDVVQQSTSNPESVPSNTTKPQNTSIQSHVETEHLPSVSTTAKQSQGILANEKYCKVCKMCKKEFANAHLMNIHYKVNHTCKLCPEVCMSRKLHTEQCHFDEKSSIRKVCKMCKKDFGNAHHMNIHYEVNHTCELCPETFISLKLHMEQCHSDDKSKDQLRCHVCKAYFKNSSGYKSHMEGSHPTDFQCKECKQYLSSAIDLENHLSRHSNPKLFSCDVCNKSFRESAVLRRHQTIHTGERKHKCPICPRSFTKKGCCTKHMLIHDHKLPFMCLYCRKRVKTLKLLINHEATCQTKSRGKFGCPTCGHLFKRPELLKQHSMIHKEPRFQCELCGRGFIYRYNLRDHMTTHSNVKEHKCDVCPAEFKTKGMLWKHQRIRHESNKFKGIDSETHI